MSTLIAIAYPNVATAEEARTELIQAVKENLVNLEDVVVVEHREDGKIKMHQAMSPSGSGAAGGAVWGGFIGLLFLAPVIGMAVGAAGGALAGKAVDVGVNDDFLKQLGTKLEPGAAAMIALGQSDSVDKLLARLKPHGGHVIQTSLDAESEEHLRAALGESVPAA